jgi:hypothetical protein
MTHLQNQNHSSEILPRYKIDISTIIRAHATKHTRCPSAEGICQYFVPTPDIATIQDNNVWVCFSSLQPSICGRTIDKKCLQYNREGALFGDLV